MTVLTRSEKPAKRTTRAEIAFVRSLGRSAKVCVTGATGFLGQRLIWALSRCGAEIVALVRDDRRVPPGLEGVAKFVVVDLRDADRLAAPLERSSIVFHCAAVTTNAVPWRVHYDTNVLGTKNVLTAAASAGVNHVVHTSSVAVYGLDNRPAAVTESEPFPTSPDRWAYYIRTKIEAEQVARAAAEDGGVGLSILRLGLLYGPGAARPVGRGLGQIGSWRFILGSGRNRLPYTYVDNALDGMLLAAAKSLPGVEAYNLVDGPPITVREAAHVDGLLRREKVRLVPVPPVLLSTAARVMEYFSRNRDTAPKLTRYVIRSATRDIAYDTQKARTRLGWAPEIDFESGLRATQRWQG